MSRKSGNGNGLPDPDKIRQHVMYTIDSIRMGKDDLLAHGKHPKILRVSPGLYRGLLALRQEQHRGTSDVRTVCKLKVVVDGTMDKYVHFYIEEEEKP